MTTMDVSATATVVRRDRLPYDEYLRDYLAPHVPVVITGALDSWAALGKWTPEFFLANYPTEKIVVGGEETTLGEFLPKVIASTPTNPCLYLKDHFIRNMPSALRTDIDPFIPYVFPNWLRGKYLLRSVNYGLNGPANPELFIGGFGTRLNELHYDWGGCHVALCQLYGRKEFTIYAPDQTPFLYADGRISRITNIYEPDLTRFPLLAQAKFVRFVQEPGEIVILPTGWWHTTRLLGPSISVALNFANHTNWNEVIKEITVGMNKYNPVFVWGYRSFLRSQRFLKILGGRNRGRASLYDA